MISLQFDSLASLLQDLFYFSFPIDLIHLFLQYCPEINFFYAEHKIQKSYLIKENSNFYAQNIISFHINALVVRRQKLLSSPIVMDTSDFLNEDIQFNNLQIYSFTLRCHCIHKKNILRIKSLRNQFIYCFQFHHFGFNQGHILIQTYIQNEIHFEIRFQKSSIRVFDLLNISFYPNIYPTKNVLNQKKQKKRHYSTLL